MNINKLCSIGLLCSLNEFGSLPAPMKSCLLVNTGNRPCSCSDDLLFCLQHVINEET